MRENKKTWERGKTKIKHMRKFLSVILAFVMLWSSVPVQAAGSESEEKKTATITVESKEAEAGQSVVVNVLIKDNPGIIGTTLEVSYDEGLTLVDGASGEAFEMLNMAGPSSYASPCRFTWDGVSIGKDEIKDGVILTLTFHVDADCVPEKEMKISVKTADGDAYDNDFNPVELQSNPGTVTVAPNFTPGDVNSDNKINATDIIKIRRNIVGYDEEINERAADVNDDCKLNSLDVVTLRRYIAQGYDVELKHSHWHVCKHEKEKIERKEPTCTEDGNKNYWYCSICNRYYSDAKGRHETTLEDTIISQTGHTEVIIPAVEPTTEKPGWTQGAYCAVCGVTYVEPQPWYIETWPISYDLANGDSYLEELVSQDKIENKNPKFVQKGEKLILSSDKDPVVYGYKFLGWYDGAGDNANRITEIKSVDRPYKFYAHWKKISYTVQYYSEAKFAQVDREENIDKFIYTTADGLVLPTLTFDGYTFTGWSDANGNMVERIKPGETGNKVFYANWISDRNQAWEKKKLTDPVIYDDGKTIVFAYKIGEIKNVPVSTVDNFGKVLSGGVTYTINTTHSSKTETSLMDSYTKAAQKATTDTASWTLSKGWSDSLSVDEEWCKENGYTREEAESISKSSTDNWYVVNNQGGSKTTGIVDSTDTYNLHTDTNNTKTYGSTDTTEHGKTTVEYGDEKTAYDSGSWEFHGDASINYKAGQKGGLEGGATAGGSRDKKFGTDTKTKGNDVTTKEDDKLKKTGSDTDTGGSDQTGTLQHHTTNTTNTSTWNSEKGFSASETSAESKSLAIGVSQKISEKTGVGKSYINTGNDSSTQGQTSAASESNEYASSTTWSNVETKEESITYTTQNTQTGYHRVVMATTADVYGMVAYDIASASYYVYTHSILHDDLHRFEDFSVSSADFNDHQTAQISFDVPSEISDYVNEKMFCTDGLQVNKDGVVEKYTGQDSYVIIPDYKAIDNMDGTRSVVKITGISSKAFQNKPITGIELNKYITDIPDNAFKGCSELWQLDAPGMTSIGDHAFEGCSKLKAFYIGKNVVHLGKNAFPETKSLIIDAANSDVVENAISSGTKAVTINLMDDMTDTLDNMQLSIADSVAFFKINGYGKTFKNLIIDSNAEMTIINRLNIIGSGKTPLQINSPDTSLRQTTVSNSGVCCILKAEKTELGLYGETKLTSEGPNALLLKGAVLTQEKEELATKLNVTGDVVYCEDLVENDNLIFTKGEKRKVDCDTLNKLMTSYDLTFDAKGGECDTKKVTVPTGTPIGQTCKMPTPAKTGFKFGGWKLSDGTLVTDETVFSSGEDQTVYAEWIPEEYTVNWKEVEGGIITVERTQSPNAMAATGLLSNGDKIYYGDKLVIEYFPKKGFSMSKHGIDNATVTGSINEQDIFIKVIPDEYTVTWNNGTGYTIHVSRTSSPYKEAETGELNSGSAIYYGDTLDITYQAVNGYSLGSNKGITSVTVSGNLTASDIYASATANSYTYKILYRSTNGTDLGSSSARYAFGTTNTISAPGKDGYNTPGAQSVKWDSTTAKTITFYYSPVGTATTQRVADQWGYQWSGKYGVHYVVDASYQNRTANSVQIQLHWIDIITPQTKYGYTQTITPYINGYCPGAVTLPGWPEPYAGQPERYKEHYTGWVTVSVSPGTRSVSVSGTYNDQNGASSSWSSAISIPTY